ncbi:MAG TPA: lactate utilization protein [Rectinema sp.]|mgnify:FL=1|jgi:L-lactate utilization protein LutB|nr:lactate utilization protein [Rectinema sp.]HOI99258.1 lactate utilization protein [Rectinema sp.]HPN92803.1 lactate utilization protein [Rectinema sp.]HQL85907.1 lactate utilization protein [Rectinema sp.]
MDELHTRLYQARGLRTVSALQKNAFDALYVATAAEAAEKVLAFVYEGARVGFGGSMTIKSMNIQERAEKKGAIILDHNKAGLGAEEKMQILRSQLTCDVFISSANAITMEGFIFNVDGNGNRVAALSFGPKKNVIVAGMNKVVANLDEAYERLRTYASPLNNIRLEKPNPCVTQGYCADCVLPTRICRIYQVLRRKPSLSDFTVILVGEDLGF